MYPLHAQVVLPASLAHDLRAPLHLILGYVRLLAKDTEGDVANKLAIIEKNGEIMLQLIEDALGERFGESDELSVVVPSSPGNEEKHPAQQRTLLVVDDVEENRELLDYLCSSWGFRVEHASNGMEALAICLRADPPIDAALVDQFMPEMDGWGFLRAVREQETMAHLPVILISAARPTYPADFPGNLAFNHVVIKPLNTDKLASYLRQLFDGTENSDQKPSNAIARLPTVKREEFRAMLELGQIVALQHWADNLAQEQPDHHDLAQEIKQRCQTIDLAGLHQLFEQTAQ